MKIFKSKPTTLLLIFALVIISCEQMDNSTDSAETSPSNDQVMYIDDPLIFAMATWDEAVAPDTIIDDYLVFDFSNDTLITKGYVNGFLTYYITPTSCDDTNWVYNFTSEEWDRFSPTYEYFGPCLHVLSPQLHELSVKYPNISDYINDLHQVHIRPYPLNLYMYGEGYEFELYPMFLNPGYSITPLLSDSMFHTYGMAFDGTDYWIGSNRNKIYQISQDGDYIGSFDAPYIVRGIAYDGSNIWVATRSDSIIRYTTDGELSCRLSALSEFIGDMTWAENSLWMVDNNPSGYHLDGFDPITLCDSSQAVAFYTINLDIDSSITGLAWDGSHFLVAADMLYVVDTNGVNINSYDWPVYGRGNIDFRDGLLHVETKGPLDFDIQEKLIARFRLP